MARKFKAAQATSGWRSPKKLNCIKIDHSELKEPARSSNSKAFEVHRGYSIKPGGGTKATQEAWKEESDLKEMLEKLMENYLDVFDDNLELKTMLEDPYTRSP